MRKSDSEDLLLSDVSDDEEEKPTAKEAAAKPAVKVPPPKPSISKAAIDDMPDDQELSFSLAGTTPSKASPPKVHPAAPSRPVIKGPTNLPKGNPPNSSPSTTVKLTQGQDSPQRTTASCPTRVDVTATCGCDTTHIVGVERIEREHLQQTAKTEWAHLLRQLSISEVDARRKEKERLRYELAASREKANTDRKVDPAMQQYVQSLKEPRSRSEIEKLHQTRQSTAKKLKQSTDRTAELEEEMRTRKEYTQRVTEEVKRQEGERLESMQSRLSDAKDQERQTVTQLAQRRKEDMATTERNRLKSQKMKHAYVTANGNYEDRATEGDKRRLIREALTSHGAEKEEKMRMLRGDIAKAANERRDAAAAKAEQTERLEAERRKIAQQRRVEQRALSSQLESDDAAEHRAALDKLHQEESALSNDQIENDREQFLTRMTGNATLNVEVERARQQRAADERELWASKQAATKEAQELARVSKIQAAKNHALQTRIESLMIDEARVVQEAKERLQRRLQVERRQQERIAQLDNNSCNQRKVLEAMYGHERAASCPPLHSPTKVRSLHHEASQPTIRARDVVEREEHERRKLFSSPPRRSKILSPISTKPSYAFPTRLMLENPPANANPRILELAQRILELEQGSNVKETKASATDRAAARERLTHRSAAQEASRFAHIQTNEATIHDGVPPQAGVSRRLYNVEATRSPATVNEGHTATSAADGDGNVEAFVKRFYEEPLQRRERSAAQNFAKVVGPQEDATVFPEKEIGCIVDRLYSTTTRHVHNSGKSMHKRRQPDKKTIPHEDAVERFYTTPLQRQKEEIAALDKLYL